MRLIGTAGHIDHGKTTLVQALTGIHPSRLPEEHAREMTIDLGYAHLDHPDGYRLGLVDVPGHEKLIRNMVAGATGFELALWVVDAREGLMPQSLEHLQILELLRVRALIPVITKAELATGDQVAETRHAAEALLQRVRLPLSPVHVVDSVSGRGIPQLKQCIFALCRGRDDERGQQLPYLPIDRVFTLRGIGTVVTGTLLRGRLAEGEPVTLSSRPGSWRIRSLNNHHTRVAAIDAGHRVGINLAGLDADAARRGDVLVGPGYPYRTRFLNARLHWVENAARKWKHGLRLLFYTGCAEMECRLWGVEGDWGQVELPADTYFFPGQRFILRGTSPLVTVGGGEVLDLVPDRPRRVTAAERAAYRLRERGEPWLPAYLAGCRRPVADLASLALRWMLPEADLARVAAASPEVRVASAAAKGTARTAVWASAAEPVLLARLQAFAERQPRAEQLVPHERLARELNVQRAHLPPLLTALFDLPAAALLRSHARLDATGLVLYPGIVAWSASERALADRILGQLEREGLRPARVQQLRLAHSDPAGRVDQVDRVLAKLVEDGRLVEVSPDFLLHGSAVAELRRSAARHAENGVRAAEFGRALGLSRKYSIPYLEYLNREGVLRRDGDLHYLASPPDAGLTPPAPGTPPPRPG